MWCGVMSLFMNNHLSWWWNK